MMMVPTSHLATACAAVVLLALAMAPVVHAHGSAAAAYESTVTGIDPAALPVDVRIEGGDEIRIENFGDEELLVCGYVDDACEPYVRLGPDGVYVNENSRTWFANRDESGSAPVPESAGEGPAEWSLVRREPAFFSYHDHRVHWMGDDVPTFVDTSDPGRQLVFDWKIPVRYGDDAAREGEIAGQLHYVGGQSLVQRMLVPGLVVAAILAMVAAFALDARRRRRTAASTSPAGSGG